MKKNKKLWFLPLVIVIILILLVGCSKTCPDSSNTINNEVLDNSTIETTELPSGITENDETNLEQEGFEETSDELIYGTKYDDISGDSVVSLSKSDTASTSFVYYSQIDSRWKNHSYTILGDSSQNIGSSGCGPTSAAMVVSSLSGTYGQYTINPAEMGDLYVSHGFRTENSGTYYSAFQWTATYFGLEYNRVYSVDSAVELIKQGYCVIISCSSGLFTYSGHFIVAYGLDGNNIKIYDPYLYNGKFDTSARKNKVTISGNTVYCSIDTFKNYASSKAYFGFKGTNNIIDNTTNDTTSSNTIIKYVNTNSGNLNVRSNSNTSSKIISSLTKGTQVEIIDTVGNWSKISNPISGWVNNSYLSSINPINTSTVITKYTTGTYKTKCNVKVRSGAGTNYLARTYSQLTSNARQQNKTLGNYYYNGYLKGVKFTVTKIVKVGNYYWGKCASGYVRLDNCTKL
jgi:uncharacterized protein YgiM (DUF1202 family)